LQAQQHLTGLPTPQATADHSTSSGVICHALRLVVLLLLLLLLLSMAAGGVWSQPQPGTG
jgi:hypothetical protein